MSPSHLISRLLPYTHRIHPQVRNMTATHLSTLCCVVPVSDSVLAKLRDGFQKVHYHPDENIPKDVLGEVDMWFTNPYGLPKSIVNVDQIPRTICVQITSGRWSCWVL